MARRSLLAALNSVGVGGWLSDGRAMSRGRACLRPSVQPYDRSEIALCERAVGEQEDVAGVGIGAGRGAPRGAPGPFALSDEAALKELATRARLRPVVVQDVECTWIYPAVQTALRGLLSAGPAVKAIQTSGEEAVREAIIAAITPFKLASSDYQLEKKFRYLIATA